MKVFLGGTCNNSNWRNILIQDLKIEYFDPVVDDSNKRPEKTLLCILEHDEDSHFSGHQLKSLKAVGDMVIRNGGLTLYNLESVSNYLNKKGDF